MAYTAERWCSCIPRSGSGGIIQGAISLDVLWIQGTVSSYVSPTELNSKCFYNAIVKKEKTENISESMHVFAGFA